MQKVPKAPNVLKVLKKVHEYTYGLRPSQAEQVINKCALKTVRAYRRTKGNKPPRGKRYGQ